MNEDERHKQEYLEFREQYQKDLLLIHKGRMKRLDFLFSVFALKGLTRVIEKFETPQNSDYIFYFIYIPLLYLVINFICKRVRDIGLSSWWTVIPTVLAFLLSGTEYLANEHFLEDIGLIALVIVGLTFLLPLYFWPSQKRDNKYGRYYPYGYISGYKAPKAPKPKKKRAL